MKVVADSHALIWFTQDSPQLSTRASKALRQAEATDGIAVSVATLVDLWYVTQTTEGVSRKLLRDPWDRFIVATALVLRAPLVTRDGAIHNSGLAETVW